jgi:hypothetical protein
MDAMKRIAVLFTVVGMSLFLLFGGIIGCGNPSQDTTAKATPVPPTPTHITINTQNELKVTLADSNRQVTVTPGTTIELQLNDQAYDHWIVSLSRSDILEPWSNAPMPAHIQGIFNAKKAGTAQITATGQPVCKPGESCQTYPQTFQINITVS